MICTCLECLCAVIIIALPMIPVSALSVTQTECVYHDVFDDTFESVSCVVI